MTNFNEMNDRNLITLPYGETELRIVIKEGEPWFILKDVCKGIEVRHVASVAERLDDDEKGVVLSDTLKGFQEMTVISESGLYSVIMSSRKPAARKFRRWVTQEVLPSIRKTGSYSIGGAGGTAIEAVVNASVSQMTTAVAEYGTAVAEYGTNVLSVGKVIDNHHDWCAELMLKLSGLVEIILPETHDTIYGLKEEIQKLQDGFSKTPKAAFSFAHIEGKACAILCQPDCAEGITDAEMQELADKKAEASAIPVVILLPAVNDARQKDWMSWSYKRKHASVIFGVGEMIRIGTGQYRRNAATGAFEAIVA